MLIIYGKKLVILLLQTPGTQPLESIIVVSKGIDRLPNIAIKYTRYTTYETNTYAKVPHYEKK